MQTCPSQLEAHHFTNEGLGCETTGNAGNEVDCAGDEANGAGIETDGARIERGGAGTAGSETGAAATLLGTYNGGIV